MPQYKRELITWNMTRYVTVIIPPELEEDENKKILLEILGRAKLLGLEIVYNVSQGWIGTACMS